MNIKDIFINQAGRLRSGWRFAIFMFALIFLSSVFGGIIGAILYYLPSSVSEDNPAVRAAPILVMLVFSITLGWLCGKFLEDLPFRALGCWFTKNWAKDFAAGFALGAATIGCAVLLTVIFGATGFQINRAGSQSAIVSTLIFSLLVFTVAAAAEEVFFRGYILQTFTRAKLTLFAVALTAVLFGYAHVRNPSANYLSFFNTLLAGVWFGAAYLKTRTLWFAFGLHLSWNWVQGAILGISVSGINDITPAPLLLPTNYGSPILTGGDYGIEGGIACTIALIFSSALIWFVPILKPTEEMLTLTNEESKRENFSA